MLPALPFSVCGRSNPIRLQGQSMACEVSTIPVMRWMGKMGINRNFRFGPPSRASYAFPALPKANLQPEHGPARSLGSHDSFSPGAGLLGELRIFGGP